MKVVKKVVKCECQPIISLLLMMQIFLPFSRHMQIILSHMFLYLSSVLQQVVA